MRVPMVVGCAVIVLLAGCGGTLTGGSPSTEPDAVEAVALPPPRLDGDTSVETALQHRRSVRDYDPAPLTLEQVGQLLWAAQGVTDPRGLRTAPSAGALYPLELYVLVGAVNGLNAGLYRYLPQEHGLLPVFAGDLCEDLAEAALGQSCVRRGSIVLLFAAVPERTTAKYGHRGHRYVHMEVGHAAQNVYLQAVSLGLGTVVVGAFDDEQVSELLRLPDDQEPLYIMPIGRLPEAGS